MSMSEQTNILELVEKSGLSKEELASKLGCNTRAIYRWMSGETTPRATERDWLNKQARIYGQYRRDNNPLFTFIDLFAGIGGLRMSFESVGGKCVFTSEWDLACRKTYQSNFPCDHPIEGDITAIAEDNIPAHDLLVAGFPCQPFSIAGVSKKNALGKKHGFSCDTQGTLFFDTARIIAHHRPAAFLLENVKNLASHDRGHTFKVIKKVLREDIGYYIDSRVVNAKGYVPQNRERIFIVGFREDVGFDFEQLEVPDPEDGPKLRSVLHPQDGSEPEEPPYTHGSEGKVESRYTLSNNLWAYLKKYAAKHRARGNGFGYGLVGPDDVARTLSARYYKDGSEILIRQRGKTPRRLTPRECARLMGFEGPGKPHFEIPVSDTQAYKQFGNAVVVPVVDAVANFMLPHICSLMDKNKKQVGLALRQPPMKGEKLVSSA